MEGVPKLPMLSIEGKPCGGHTEFTPYLMQYILQKYQEEPGKYELGIEKLMELREIGTRMGGDGSGVKALKEYYGQLHLLKTRFPMEAGDSVALPFSWYEKFSDISSPTTYEDINYEMACVLHNIGAIHSSLGTAENRGTPDSMKAACTHFQHALFAFTHLQEMRGAKEFSPDFDDSVLAFYSVLMQAQAQECILEKSIIDHRKDVIVAKVANQVSDFYEKCSALLDAGGISEITGSSKVKGWRKFTQMKAKVYSAVANLYMGQSASDQSKFGERLSWYQIAEADLAEATKLAQKETDGVQESLQFCRDVVLGKLENAKKENDFIYHEKVPSPDSLTPIPKVVLVKGIAFDPLDPAVSGPDLFASLIPGRVHVSNSVYSEEKAKLLRQVDERVAQKEETLREFLGSMDLDSLNLSGDGEGLDLPDTLLECSSAFNAQPEAVPNLISSLQRLTGCYQETESKLSDFDQRLSSIQRWLEETSRNRSVMPAVQEFIPKGIEIQAEYKESLEQYKKAHAQATFSNTELQKAVAYHSENLKLLGLPLSSLRAALPVSQKVDTPEREEMQRLAEKVEEMRTQRANLVGSLRADVHADDLTRRLLAEKDADAKELFEKELEKFSKKIEIIDQNLNAQDNILRAMTRANAMYADARKQANNVRRERDNRIQGLIGSYEAYQGVLTKAEGGRLFYEKLLSTLNEFEDDLEKLEEAVEERRRLVDTTKGTPQPGRTPQIPHSASLPQPSPTSKPGGAGPVDRERKGPRLGDYMAYYRAKQAGSSTMPPPSSGTGPQGPSPGPSPGPPSQIPAIPGQLPQQFPTNPSAGYSMPVVPQPIEARPGNPDIMSSMANSQSFHGGNQPGVSTPYNMIPSNVRPQYLPAPITSQSNPPLSGQQGIPYSVPPSSTPAQPTATPSCAGNQYTVPNAGYSNPQVQDNAVVAGTMPHQQVPSNPSVPSYAPVNIQDNTGQFPVRHATPNTIMNTVSGVVLPAHSTPTPTMPSAVGHSALPPQRYPAVQQYPQSQQYPVPMNHQPQVSNPGRIPNPQPQAFSGVQSSVKPLTSVSGPHNAGIRMNPTSFGAHTHAMAPQIFTGTPGSGTSHNGSTLPGNPIYTGSRTETAQNSQTLGNTAIHPFNTNHHPAYSTQQPQVPVTSFPQQTIQSAGQPGRPNNPPFQQQYVPAPFTTLPGQPNANPGLVQQNVQYSRQNSNGAGTFPGAVNSQPPVNQSVAMPTYSNNSMHHTVNAASTMIRTGVPQQTNHQQNATLYSAGQIPLRPQVPVSQNPVASMQPGINAPVSQFPPPNMPLGYAQPVNCNIPPAQAQNMCAPNPRQVAPVRFNGMDAPIQDPSLPLPLEPKKVEEPSALAHQLTPTEKALADVFAPVVQPEEPVKPTLPQPRLEVAPKQVVVKAEQPLPPLNPRNNEALTTIEKTGNIKPQVREPVLGLTKTIPDVIPDGDKGSIDRTDHQNLQPILTHSPESNSETNPSTTPQIIAKSEKSEITGLLDPNTFELGESRGTKKTKKEEFFKDSTGNKTPDETDPFSFLDPFANLKGK